MKKLYILLLAVFFSYHSFAQWNKDPLVANNKVCDAPGDQRGHFAVSDNQGGSIVVWEDRRTTNTNNLAEVFAERIDVNGNVLWSSANPYKGRQLSSTSCYRIGDVIPDESGGVVVVWEDQRVNGESDVYIQRINAAGVPLWTANGLAVCNAAGFQVRPMVVSDGSGGYIIVWVDDRGGAYGQRLNSAGVAQWGVNGRFLALASSLNVPCGIVADGNNGAIIFLVDLRNSTGLDPSGFPINVDIYAQRINGNAVLQWGASGVEICTAQNNQLLDILSEETGKNHVISDGSGGAIIMWDDYRNNPANTTNDDNSARRDYYAQRVDGAGRALWTRNGVRFNSNDLMAYNTKIVKDETQGCYAVWAADRQNVLDESNVYCQHFSATGQALLPENGVLIKSAARHPDIVRDNGSAIVSFEMNDFSGVYVQKLDGSNGSFLWPANGVPVCTVPFSAPENPKLTNYTNGGAIVVWQDHRNAFLTATDLYAGAVSANGNLPVTWKEISATYYTKAVEVKWQTSSESNTSHFDLERSADGSTFTFIGRTAASGNSNSTKSYKALDIDANSQNARLLYYRVKQVDLDGKFSFSKVVTVNIVDILPTVKLMGNPVKEEIRLMYNSMTDSRCEIEILTSAGQLLYKKSHAVNTGANIIHIPVGNWGNSMYILKVKGDRVNNTFKVYK